MKINLTRTVITSIVTLCVFSAASCGKKSSAGTVTPTNPTTPTTPTTPLSSDVAMWLTTADQTNVFSKQNVSINFGTSAASGPLINIDAATTYQTIDGFGYCLTGGSAQVINLMSDAQKNDLLTDLFATDGTHIGVSYLRITIGASDLSAFDYTYDEVTPGQTDVDLKSFSIDQEKTDLIPILKKIIAINPAIKILATPWTAPTWMKTAPLGENGFKGGSLNTAYYDTYAKYFVKYIQAMKAQGITIDAVTPQNEPLNAYNNPAMTMQSNEEADFVKNNLGPQFKAAGITAKIIVYDHNADHTEYPTDIYKDAVANPYIDGSAFHLYAGSINSVSAVHDAYPAKNLYFTEQYTPATGGFGGDLSWHVTNLIVGATRNWCRNVLEWNLATDPSFGPHTNGGCDGCKGALTINSATSVTRNVSYYIIAHASKFVRPGAVRIASDYLSALPNVAFRNTDGSTVLIVLNSGTSQQSFSFKIGGKTATSTLDAGAVATYVW
ncbi:glycoside hydrolase family 30 protein [Mucilaginibacter flavus]|uniref:glycoside hydrolase family 30 protein n=1 Tax=Mucilaginibacter flavus TaxID=931504 RepID=UPI0025B3C5B4|nr:glycoside hydrolase family 30 beta sandwich domain-containing protein [Mucilaginibacter flavus]MDN3581686.1 glycoside hydrolase family 30 beta sandwich domain-containing protein [Mucilaginibacter flavus]